uniref:Meiosis specific with OB-fold n=1 Tax=Kryptolebias marmoratus TaxID=37003 RepID=A0A3Q3ADQ2_KRYMA
SEKEMAAQSFLAISELHPSFSHPKVVGVIIGKTDVRSFPDRKIPQLPLLVRNLLSLSADQDSPDFFINVTAWGNDGYVNGLASSFGVGDCVAVENSLVSNKDPEKGDKFCPTTPRSVKLLVTEAHSQVYPCADVDTVDRLLPLIHLPVKDSRDFYSLGDIVANGPKLDGAAINILAAIKQMGEVKQFTTSDGRRGQRLEVKLFDDSVSSFPLVCWDKETILTLQTFVAKETVLFVADAKVSFDKFRGGMVATVTPRSVVTANPDTREASLLFSYAKEASESGALDQDEAPEDPPGMFRGTPLDSITDVYTVSQLKEKAKGHPEAFFGVTYSFVSRLDLDSSVSKVIKTRCCRCKYQVTEALQSCTNPLCSGRGQALSAAAAFDLLVDLTDHTGTLQACSLRGVAAEQTLGCTILPSARAKSGIRGAVLSCSLADPGEVKQHMSALLLQR